MVGAKRRMVFPDPILTGYPREYMDAPETSILSAELAAASTEGSS